MAQVRHKSQRTVILLPKGHTLSSLAKVIQKVKHGNATKKKQRLRPQARRALLIGRRPSSPRNDNRFLMHLHATRTVSGLQHALSDFGLSDLNTFGSNLPTQSPIVCSA